MSTAEGPEIFDSLPYYDDDLEKYPHLKQLVEQELAKEARPTQTLHPKVPPPVTLFAVRKHIFHQTKISTDVLPPEQPIITSRA